ncbi:hypothetical protein GCM10018987_25030 [Streptomyces cremeus]
MGTSSRASPLTFGMGSPAQQPLQCGVQVSGQLCVVGTARSGQRPYDYQATGGQLGDPVAHEVAQSPLHRIAYDSNTNGLAHDETRTRRGSALPCRVRVRCTATA